MWLTSWLKYFKSSPLSPGKCLSCYNGRYSWSDSSLFLIASFPITLLYTDAATLKLPFISSHFILLLQLSFQVDRLLRLHYSPTLILPLGLPDTTSYKRASQILQSSPEASLLWYHSNYCAFKIIVFYPRDNKLCENSSEFIFFNLVFLEPSTTSAQSKHITNIVEGMNEEGKLKTQSSWDSKINKDWGTNFINKQ